MDPGRCPLLNRHYHDAGGVGGGGGREDCWSEGATADLIEAWGDRHLRLSRGSLRQKDWKEVADAVNERRMAAGKLPKTDSQCKNRIDTLKKKYKIEKAKPGPSQWSFFSTLDLLVGDVVSEPYSRPSPPVRSQYSHPLSKRHLSLASTCKHRNPDLGAAVCSPGSSESSPREFLGRNYYVGIDNVLKEGDAEDNDDEEEEEEEEEPDHTVNRMFDSALLEKQAKRQRNWGVFGCDLGDGRREGAFGELARAIMKFADVYERVENSKQQQMMELERKRMEFAKDLEFQRMQMLMEAQIELEKMKRPKNTPVSVPISPYREVSIFVNVNP
ncbi:hypothetical protein Cni_G23596 [Canna indica]|uniref:Myb/SANT-like DNA-binding domain-containing protein n=1 Tax=Canna indica TaxID=4628 RepID=A0AAQ3KUD9_9LILI|nr:hypothetical protein Cni_G23596 [Canna indica]